MKDKLTVDICYIMALVEERIMTPHVIIIVTHNIPSTVIVLVQFTIIFLVTNKWSLITWCEG